MQIRERTDIELADINPRHALLGPEEFPVHDDAPGVEILDGEVGEERDPGPEGNRAQQLVTRFGGRTRIHVPRKQEIGDGRSYERAGRETDIVEPAVGQRLITFEAGGDQRDQQADEPNAHRLALGGRLGDDREQRRGRESQRRADRPENDARPSPWRHDQDDTGEDHHSQLTGSE